MKKITTIFLLLGFIVFETMAGGYQVRLQGQKQTGIGLIGTPFAFGASSIFYNPGSLSFMEQKYSLSAGVSPIFATAVFQAMSSDYTAETDNPTGTPFYVYAAAKITEDLSAGVGVYTPFGSSITWNPNWEGRTLIQKISLKTIYYQPTLAYKINEHFGLGAGLVIATGNVDLTREVPAPVYGIFNMTGSTTALGYNIGGYVNQGDFSLGVDYRSKVTMKIDNGDMGFTEIPSSLTQYFPESGKYSAELPMPANLDIGLAYNVNEKLKLAVEMNYVMWSIYDSLIIDFKENNEKLADSKNPRHYKNRMIYRIGGEYKINDKFIARVGFYYDPTPTNKNYFTPETVSLNTVAFTFGLSIMPVKNLSIDLSYLQLEGLKEDRTYTPDNFGGTYRTRTFIPGIGIGYNF